MNIVNFNSFSPKQAMTFLERSSLVNFKNSGIFAFLAKTSSISLEFQSVLELQCLDPNNMTTLYLSQNIFIVSLYFSSLDSLISFSFMKDYRLGNVVVKRYGF